LKHAKASMEENEFSVLTQQTKFLMIGNHEQGYKSTIISIPAKKMVCCKRCWFRPS